MLLFFAWRGTTMRMEWPPAGVVVAQESRPDAKAMKWAADVRKIASKMTPKDRLYLANFYKALGFILRRDADRDQPILGDTTRFEQFHGGSLEAAIDRKDVGKYDGLGAAIDETFIAAAGAGVQQVTPEVREKLLAACSVLSWTFAIHGE
jgi:hypothetical protein